MTRFSQLSIIKKTPDKRSISLQNRPVPFLTAILKVEKSKTAINTVTVPIVIPKLSAPPGNVDVLWGTAPAKYGLAPRFKADSPRL